MGRSYYQIDLLNPGHENCRHKDYMLSCHNYEVLLQRANGHCELCGMLGMYNQWRKLHIDHDNMVGQWGVRGLLCYLCNTHMFNPKVVDPDRLSRFLAAPFYLDVLKAYGAPLYMDEPPIKSEVTVTNGRTWTRGKRGWMADTYGRAAGTRSWHYLHRRYGPHLLGQMLRLPSK